MTRFIPFLVYFLVFLASGRFFDTQNELNVTGVFYNVATGSTSLWMDTIGCGLLVPRDIPVLIQLRSVGKSLFSSSAKILVMIFAQIW